MILSMNFISAKDDTGMTNFLKEALKAAKSQPHSEVVKALKTTYISKRQVGAAEAVYRINSAMHLRDSNVKCIFVATGFPENRWTMFRKVSDIDTDTNVIESDTDNFDDEETEDYDPKKVKIPGRAGEFKETITVHDRYKNRPNGLQALTLAQFATIYEPRKTVPKRTLFLHGLSEEDGFARLISDQQTILPKYIELKNNFGFMAQRGNPCVLRVHNSKKKEGHEQYYADMLLYLPWRDEVNDLYRNEPDECIDLFRSNLSEIEQNKKGIFPYSGALEAIQALEKDEANLRPEHIYETLDAEGNQQNEDDANEGVPHNRDFAGLDPDLLETREEPDGTCNSRESYKYRQIDIQSDEQLSEMARTLVAEQQVVLNEIIAFCKSTVLARNGYCELPTQKHLIVHGGAGKRFPWKSIFEKIMRGVHDVWMCVFLFSGSGKSKTICIVAKWAEKLLRKAGDHPNKPRVLLTGPTGMASALIGGTTLHSAFNFRFGNEYPSLSDKMLDTYRNNLKDLKLLIVDEISMITSDMLINIHRRLCDVFQSKDLFGGISVVLVGDLLQLPPVQGRFIFDRPLGEKAAIAHDLFSIWKEFTPVILEHNHRQGDASTWADALNRFRFGKVTDEDKALLESRVIPAESAPKDCCHIFYTNMEVARHNAKVLSDLTGESVVIEATIIAPRGYSPSIKQDGRIDQTQFLQRLEVKLGARVMLISNVNTTDELVNGAMGIIVGIERKDNKVIDCIIVRFDNETVGEGQRAKNPKYSAKFKNQNGTPIFRHEQEYFLGKRQQHSASARIFQFPLRLSAANTGHKMQGQTVKSGSKVVIHWSSRCPPGLAYVMLGRSENIEDIFITGILRKHHSFIAHFLLEVFVLQESLIRAELSAMKQQRQKLYA